MAAHADRTFDPHERPTQPGLRRYVAETSPSLRPTAPPSHARIARTGKGLPSPEAKPPLETTTIAEKVTLAPPPPRRSSRVRRRPSADVEVVTADLRRDPRSED